MIGSMNQDELRALLRFITSSPVCIAKTISVSFNSLSGLARRPIAHTCDCNLELPVSYMTYLEFLSEFKTVLSTEECSYMDEHSDIALLLSYSLQQLLLNFVDVMLLLRIAVMV